MESDAADVSVKLSACVIAKLSFTNQFNYARGQACFNDSGGAARGSGSQKIHYAGLNDGPKHS
jgi:hypothetical protein